MDLTTVRVCVSWSIRERERMATWRGPQGRGKRGLKPVALPTFHPLCKDVCFPLERESCVLTRLPNECTTPTLGWMTPTCACLPRPHRGLQTALGISAWTSKYNPSWGRGQPLGVFLAGEGDLLLEGHFSESGLG